MVAYLNETRCTCIAVGALLAVLAGLVGLPCAAQAQAEQSIVVLVNDDPITVYDVEQRERFLAVTTQEQPSPALKKKATDMLIEERLQIQQGRKLGLTPDEDDVNKVLVGMAKNNNMSPDQLATALGQMGVNIKTLRDRIRSQVVWQDVVRKKFRRNVSIGEADVDKALTDAGESGQAEGGDHAAIAPGQVRDPDRRRSSGHRQAARRDRSHSRQGAVLLQLLDADQGHQGLQGESAAGSAAGLARPADAHAGDEREGGSNDSPTLSGSAIEAYAVCGKHAVKGDPEKRQQTEMKLLEQELGIRAEGLLRDMRQDAFIEYR